MLMGSLQCEHPAHELRQELERFLVQSGYACQRFIPSSSIEKCWPENLESLRRMLGLHSWDDSMLADLSCRCRTITCIFAWIQYEPFDDKLKEICQLIQDDSHGVNTTILVDSRLTLDRDTCVRLLGFQQGLLFYEEQFVFTPILISSAARGVQKVQPKMCWPYASPPKEIGFGAYSRVYEVDIVKDQIQYSDDFSSAKAKTVAYKQIKNFEDWRKEIKVLDFLKESLSKHDRVTLHIAAFIQGQDFYIFLPHTPLGDLETFLNEGVWKDGESRDLVGYDFAKEFKPFGIRELATEFAAIIDATAYLHDRVSSVRGIPVYCAHADLRPKNILVFPGSDENPAGVWHISDFGISSVKLEGGQSLPDPVLAMYPSTWDIVEDRGSPSRPQSTVRRLVGAYVAPERSLLGWSSPKESDIWSLGCIFTEILAFSLGSPSKGSRRAQLYDFRGQRPTWNGLDRDDYFYDCYFPKVSRDTQIEITIQRRPKVTEWLHRFYSDYNTLYQYLATIVHRMLQPDPDSRCDAKSAYRWIVEACIDCSTSRVVSGRIQPPLLGDSGMQILQADPWRFLASRSTDPNSSDDALMFIKTLGGEDIEPSKYSGRVQSLSTTATGLPIDSVLLNSPRSYSFQNSKATKINKITSRVWGMDGTSLSTPALAVGISSMHGTIVYLCQTQEFTESQGSFTSKKAGNELSFELRFRLSGQQTDSFKTLQSHKLPPCVEWSQLRVDGKHAIVVGARQKSKEIVVYVHEFTNSDLAQIDASNDSDVLRMRNFVPSPDKAFAAHDDQRSAIWKTGQKIYDNDLSQPFGASAQLAFGKTGSFLFTWSCGNGNDTIQIWKADLETGPYLCATYRLPRPSERAQHDMFLIPCGSSPNCVLRDSQGIWYTTSEAIDVKGCSNEVAVVTPQVGPSPQSLNTAALCAANERHFLYVSTSQQICVYDLIWGNATLSGLQKRADPLAETTVQDAISIALVPKTEQKYDLIICNPIGAVEVIEMQYQ